VTARRAVGAATRAAGVIGTPIRHSLSPAIFEAAFAACDLDWTYLAFDVAEGDAAGAMEGVRALGLEGVSVTMPHKAAVLPALDEVDEVAAALGAVNCVVRRGRTLVGHNTDGAGFLDSLRLDEGLDVEGRRCLVLGAGGAGRAVAYALGGAGAASVTIANRDQARAEAAADLAGVHGAIGTADQAPHAELVVNATSLGMGDDGRLPLDPGLLHDQQVVVDLVYHPADTPLLRAAASAGARTVGGLGMLVHQAGHAFRHWTGQDPPLDAMRASARAALAARRS
jgi:shikimate dehydrogenase